MAVVQITYHQVTELHNHREWVLSCRCGWMEKVADWDQANKAKQAAWHVRTADRIEILPPATVRSRRAARLVLG